MHAYIQGKNTFAYVHAWKESTHAYVHGKARMHAYMHGACVHAWKTIRMHTCTEKHMCMHTHMVHACIHGKEYARIHARKAHMHACIHGYTHESLDGRMPSQREALVELQTPPPKRVNRAPHAKILNVSKCMRILNFAASPCPFRL